MFINKRYLYYLGGRVNMTINILGQYLDLCKKMNTMPTLRGANRFKNNINTLNYLLSLGLERLVIDIIG